MNAKPVMLVILDGFGYSKKKVHNAIYHAHTPHLDRWSDLYPMRYIQAAGAYVGLPEQSVGNSEVGHLTIGAGRVIEQPLTRINNAIDDDSLASNRVLVSRLENLRESGGALHILGLLSDAGIHGHIDHIAFYAACAARHGIKRIFVHAFLDGRDTPPQSAALYLESLEGMLKKYHATLATIQGRFFAMDRDNNWDRTLKAYSILTEQCATKSTDWRMVLDDYYTDTPSDEFIPPVQLDPHGYIQDGDGIIFANIRPDRARQLTACFVAPTTVPNGFLHIHPSFFISPISYAAYLATDVLFETASIAHTLKEELSAVGKTMYAIAETEKYAHITYFFNGQKEKPVAHEERCLIPSRRLRDYRHCPEMSAHEITCALLSIMEHDPKDFYLVNYANADMVGHSGDSVATIKAIECLDHELGIVYEHFVERMDGMMIITADHGKAEDMFDDNMQQPQTGHTANPVPFLCMTKNPEEVPDIESVKQLADIAPFILRCMHITVPDEMQQKKAPYLREP